MPWWQFPMTFIIGLLKIRRLNSEPSLNSLKVLIVKFNFKENRLKKSSCSFAFSLIKIFQSLSSGLKIVTMKRSQSLKVFLPFANEPKINAEAMKFLIKRDERKRIIDDMFIYNDCDFLILCKNAP